MDFSKFELSDNIARAIEDMGFSEPTPVQDVVIPLLLQDDRDIIALAQTGTGKTAAFGLPIIERLDLKKNRPQALILSPTRELCLQITDDLQKFSKYIKDVRIVSVYGGAPIDKQIRKISRGVHIVVATPGRLNDLLRRKAIRLDLLQKLVLDEADEMLNMGFQEELDDILSHIPGEHQTLLFSATMPDQISRITRQYMNSPREITIGSKNSGAKNVDHIYYMVQSRDRYKALKRVADFYPDMYCIVFCRTRAETQDVANHLIKDGYDADSLHGDLSQAMRDRVMEKFRLKNLQILVATDVAARGLDVRDLTHIINYNLPDELESYIHRSGRTGRAGKKGVSVIIINLKEKHKIKKLAGVLKKQIEYKKLPDGREVCEAQLYSLIERMKNVEVNEKEIEQYLPGIYESFAGMSWQDIIKHFVSLEFNHFLSYYSYDQDLNAVESGKGRKTERQTEPIKEPVTISINVGKKHYVKPGTLIGLINRVLPGSHINVGHIDLHEKHSTFEVESKDSEMLIDALNSAVYDNTPVAAGLGDKSTVKSRSKKKNYKKKGPVRQKDKFKAKPARKGTKHKARTAKKAAKKKKKN